MVEMRSITTRFGGATGLFRVDLDDCAGEVLAIVADNGTGKSTLIKILTEVYHPTAGWMSPAGETISFASHAGAIAKGIDAIYQTLALADHLDPAANIFPGNELKKNVMGVTVLDIARMRTETERVLMDRLGGRLGILDPRLSGHDQTPGRTGHPV